MNANDFQKDVMRCAAATTPASLQRLISVYELWHSAAGITTEAGEFMDPIKKYVVYGKDIDKVNLAEELGDLMWYIAHACEILGIDLADVMKNNTDKLKARYPEKFTEERAIVRDLDEERVILEQMDLDFGGRAE